MDSSGSGDIFSKFCGGSPIWNQSLLEEGTWPQFTDCFQLTVLVWVPRAWLWLTLPIYLYNLLQRDDSSVSIPTTYLNLSKTFFSLVLAILSVIYLIHLASKETQASDSVPSAAYVANALELATYLLTIIIVYLERRRGFITSGILFIFWFLSTIASVVPFYSQIIQEQYNDDMFTFAVFLIHFGCLFIELLLQFKAENVQSRRGYTKLEELVSPELYSSFPSRITFWWINRLVLTGYRKALTDKDVPVLHPRDRSHTIVPVFERSWKNEVRKCQKITLTRSATYHNGIGENLNSNKAQANINEKTPLLGYTNSIRADECKPPDDVTFTERKTEKHIKEPSLFRVLFKTYGLSMLRGHSCKLVYDLLQFVSPMILKLLIEYVEQKDSKTEYKGYVYAVSMFAVAFLATCFYHQNFQITLTVGMNIKSVLISAVYKKALTIDNDSKKTSAVGQIVNLMAVDCDRIGNVANYLHSVWSSPVLIVVSLTLLHGTLGSSIFAGVVVMVLIMPVNATIAIRQRKYQMELMKLKDARLKIMNEVLNGIKVLKLYAWEPSFQKKVSDIRNQELRFLRKYAFLNAFAVFFWTSAPLLVSLATFTTYVLTSPDHSLDAQKAFVALTLFNILRFPINMLPNIISFLIQAHVSLKRVNKFLNNTDLNPDNVQKNIKKDAAMSIKKGTFSWGRNLQPVLQKFTRLFIFDPIDFDLLKNDLAVVIMALPVTGIPRLVTIEPEASEGINLEIPHGKLYAVVGQVGCGKSSLISAFLGELEKLNGSVNVHGSIAYVAQQAWIQNTTLKANILFGKDQKKSKYDKVIEACALGPDLEVLPGGDMTEIGEKGINLSGGQKQRVSLARAVYNDADIYLFDDPLSAVDSHVGKHIFNQVVGDKGMLRKKTRILVTHGVHWLPMVDTIVVMVDGKISEIGSYEELLSHDGDFAQFLKNYLTHDDDDDDSDEEGVDTEIREMKTKIRERVESVTSDGVTSEDGGSGLSKKISSHTRQRSRSMSEGSFKGSNREKSLKASEKLIEEERAQTGKVKMTVFFAYARAVGIVASLAILLFFTVNNGLMLFSNIWLSDWTSDPSLMNKSLTNTSDYLAKNNVYLGVYAALGLGQVMFLLFYSMVANLALVSAAGALHARMLANILRSPMSFFDTTPIGRIVNRFSKDVEMIDNNLPGTLRFWLKTVFQVGISLIAISYSTPLFMVVILPLGVLYYLIQKFYVPTVRQLKRVESTTRSPIYEHFSETITGASTIRAFDDVDRFIEDNKIKVDKNLKFYYGAISSNRWLGVRLEFLGQLITLSSAMFAVLTPDISGGIVGLSISYALQVTAFLTSMVRSNSDLETNIVSVERIEEYSETPTEASWTDPHHRPEPEWPQVGKINFRNYETRYRPGLDLVLKGITVEINDTEKVGIVGRTGAGKSSLTVALFRLIESASGSIIIDGKSIADMGLHDLRSKLTILPQDPVIFSGSLRMNLDPFNQYTDDELWTALQNSHLKDFVSGLPDRLEHECGEGGCNLSVGQRQLLCLGRSLLRKTKILILDEATAAVDMETDDLIQKTIRSEFKECTVLTIAHRLNTVMDYDKIMVLDQGQITEFDSPDNLLKDRSSQFYAMCRDANLVS